MGLKRERSDTVPGSVHLLYRALEEPDGWNHALTALADELKADHVILDLRADFSPSPAEVLAARVAPDHIEGFASHAEYAALRRMLPRPAAGFVLPGEAILDRSVQSRSEFYADVIRPMGGYHSVFAVPAGGPAAPTALIAACRSSRKRAFEAPQLRHVQTIMPHLATALKLRQRLKSQSDEAWWHERTLSLLPLGVMLLDEQARLCYANPAAEALARVSRGASGLSLSLHLGLSVTPAKVNAQLRQAIRAALNPGAGPAPPPIRLPGAHPRADIWLRVVPLVADGAWAGPGRAARVAVFCDGPETHPLDAPQLATAFNLTTRETALAQALMAGQDLPGAARALCISLEAARSRLKCLFVKTGTNRQADLTHLLAAMQRWSLG